MTLRNVSFSELGAAFLSFDARYCFLLEEATSSTLPSCPLSSHSSAPSPSTRQDVVRIALTLSSAGNTSQTADGLRRVAHFKISCLLC